MIREKLEARRQAEREILAIKRQIARCQAEGGPSEYPTGRTPEKIPARKIPPKKLITDERGNVLDQYTWPTGRTNNPEGAMLQHEDGYREALEKLLTSKESLFLEVERIIEALPPGEGRARVILRHYYCLAWTDARIGEELEADARSIVRSRTRALDWLEQNYSAEVD